jgi:hypothetical protein
MLIYFFDVHYEFLCPKEAVNQAFHLQGLECLQQCTHQKRPSFWLDKYSLCHSYHLTVILTWFRLMWFFMFLKLKISLKNSHFESPEDIQSNLMTELKKPSGNVLLKTTWYERTQAHTLNLCWMGIGDLNPHTIGLSPVL